MYTLQMTELSCWGFSNCTAIEDIRYELLFGLTGMPEVEMGNKVLETQGHVNICKTVVANISAMDQEKKLSCGNWDYSEQCPEGEE